jgi:hypothetical protein
VQCLDKDYLETSKWFYYAENGGDIKYKNYVPFIVHEPAENISGNDTSLLSCGALSGSEQDCTASAAGSVPLSFNFDTTVGKFYARWITFGRDVAKYDPGQTGSCGGAKRNLLIKPGGYWPGQTEWGAGSWQTFYGNGTGFSDHVEIGPESIPYTIDIVPATDGPTTPVISGGSCVIGAPYSISFVSTDPNGHQLKYGIDWDDDGTLDQFVPPSGFVPSGTSQSASRMNAIAGQKTVRVLAQNEQGASSEWSTYSFDCSEAVTTCEDDQTLVQGVCLDFFTSCPVGYVKNGIQCVWNGCPVGYTQQADNVCIWSGCPEGYVEQSNRQCVLLSECSALPYCSGPNLYNGCTHEIIQSCEWGCANGVCKGTPSPTGSLQAAPSVVQKDHFTTITWSSSHASACTVTSTNNDTWTGLSGIQQSNPLQAQTTFYLHCEGLEDSSTATLDKSVIVNVVPNYEEK